MASLHGVLGFWFSLNILVWTTIKAFLQPLEFFSEPYSDLLALLWAALRLVSLFSGVETRRLKRLND